MLFSKCLIGSQKTSLSNYLSNIFYKCRDLEEAEDQYQMALRTHLMNIDALIKLHDSRLYSLERNFHHDLEVLQTDFLAEKSRMISKFKHEKKELAAIIDAIEQEEESRDNEVGKIILY